LLDELDPHRSRNTFSEASTGISRSAVDEICP
jgi:hypothetical protein